MLYYNHKRYRLFYSRFSFSKICLKLEIGDNIFAFYFYSNTYVP
jgi:hypothetical protein